MKGLRKPVSKQFTDSTAWIEENEYALSHVEEIKTTTRIILKLIDYMEQKGISQSELARELDVTPQYIHKLFHGQEYSFRIETAVEYGRKLGIRLIEVPEEGVLTTNKASFDAFTPIPELNSVPEYIECNNDILFNISSPWKIQSSLSIA